MRAPFPWFGGKSRCAATIWEALGDVPNYVEPFFGSGAVLLARPHAPRTETVNDLDCYLANFWRATRADADAVAERCDWPVSEVDTEARHRWLVAQAGFRDRMRTDPDYYDAKIAGWWVYGLCAWIGSGWCREATWTDDDDAGRGVRRQLPHLGHGQGVHRQLPHLGDAGQGVHRQLPHLGNAGRGDALKVYFAELADRLRGVRVACGDWTRVLGDSVTWRHGTTGIFLDPPYEDGAIDYAVGGRISGDVREWAIEHGEDERLRIVLAGYEGEHAMPEGWTAIAWKANGGYGSQRARALNGNSRRERLWISPHCLRPAALVDPRQRDLFASLVEAAE